MKVNLYPLLLLTRLCQYNLQTQLEIPRGSRKAFSSLQKHCKVVALQGHHGKGTHPPGSGRASLGKVKLSDLQAG